MVSQGRHARRRRVQRARHYLNTDEDLPPAKGQTYVLPAGTFFAIRDGKIARVTTYYNLTDWIAAGGLTARSHPPLRPWLPARSAV